MTFHINLCPREYYFVMASVSISAREAKSRGTGPCLTVLASTGEVALRRFRKSASEFSAGCEELSGSLGKDGVFAYLYSSLSKSAFYFNSS